ncbi:MAG: fibronectin type III domain-containing protein, partial [Luteolibacter sp.]
MLTYSGELGGSPSFTWEDTTGSGYLATFDSSVEGQVQITVIGPPNAPTNLVAAPGDQQAQLSWDAVMNASSYTLLRSTSSDSGFSIMASGVVGTTTIDAGLSNGVTYYYKLQAVNAIGS